MTRLSYPMVHAFRARRSFLSAATPNGLTKGVRGRVSLVISTRRLRSSLRASAARLCRHCLGVPSLIILHGSTGLPRVHGSRTLGTNVTVLMTVPLSAPSAPPCPSVQSGFPPWMLIIRNALCDVRKVYTARVV